MNTITLLCQPGMIYFFFASVLLIATSATNFGSVSEILANLPPLSTWFLTSSVVGVAPGCKVLTLILNGLNSSLYALEKFLM